MQIRARTTLLLILALASCIIFLASYLLETANPPPFTLQQYPKTDGSISTQPLAVLIACRLTHTGFVAGTMSMQATRTIYPVIYAYERYKPDKRFSLERESQYTGAPSYVKKDLWSKIEHTNTHPSYLNLINRKAEFIIAAREPSDDEIVLARHNRVEIKTLPIARDGLVFIVNSANPVANLSIEQIRAIYSGKLTNWADLGGGNEPINPYRRNRNSGSEEKMQKLVMNGLPILPAANLMVRTTYSMWGPFNALMEDRQGIGYTPYYYERYMANTPQVKIISINNVMPSHETIKNGTYPLVTEVVVAYLSDLAKDSPAARVRDWLLTAEGQKVVAESGYVPIKE